MLKQKTTPIKGIRKEKRNDPSPNKRPQMAREPKKKKMKEPKSKQKTPPDKGTRKEKRKGPKSI
jgi:hypothetical protein